MHGGAARAAPDAARQLVDLGGRRRTGRRWSRVRAPRCSPARWSWPIGTGSARCAQTFVGGASDGNFTAGIGVPTLDGLGPVGGGAHADDEHVLVASIAPRTTLLAALVADALSHP